MITFRKDTSFPFLKIAREGGVPYGKVLQAAERLKLAQRGEVDALAERLPLIALIVKAMDAEDARRRAVAP